MKFVSGAVWMMAAWKRLWVWLGAKLGTVAVGFRGDSAAEGDDQLDEAGHDDH